MNVMWAILAVIGMIAGVIGYDEHRIGEAEKVIAEQTSTIAARDRTIGEMNDAYTTLYAEKAVCEANRVTLGAALDRQNATVAALQAKAQSVVRVTTERVRSELAVKYRDHNLSQRMCNETASTIDAVRRRDALR